MKKILFLSLRDICYNSTSYFEQQISDELTNTGIQVTHLHIPKASDMAYAMLKPYYNADYDAVIDINSRIPAMKYNNEYILSHFNIPIWHYILDHPLYHYETINARLGNYHIICLDINHARLISESFPHIKGTCVLPVAARQYTSAMQHTLTSESDCSHNSQFLSDYFNRPEELIFTGTYTDSVKTSLIYSRTSSIDTHPLLQMLLNNPSLTQEEAARLIICDNPDYNSSDCNMINTDNSDSSVLEYLYKNFLIDVYLQAIIREEIITQIIKNHIHITIYGHGWDTYADKCDILAPDIRKYLHIKPEVTYDNLPHLYSTAKMSINQMPWFKYGIHDRIPLSMMNGCICISDTSKYMSDFMHIDESYGVHTYSLEALDTIPDIINELSVRISHKDNSITDELAKGYNYASNNLTWKEWVNKWLKYSQ